MRTMGVLLIVIGLCASVLWGRQVETNGFTLTPLADQGKSDIRLKREQVDVYLGRNHVWPALVRVVAQFEMVNETDQPIRLLVGFPADDVSSEGTYDFQVRINDANSLQPVRQMRREERYRFLVSRTWFVWDQTFAPGRTIISAQYHVQTFPCGMYSNGVYENLRYILDTGAPWKGTIAQADIRVHFADPLAAEQVREWTWPQSWRIDGNDLCWSFQNFEPELKDNLFIAYLPRGVYDDLERFRRAVRANPQDQTSVLALARLCFSLARGPGSADPGGYDMVFYRMQDANDREYQRFEDALVEATAPRREKGGASDGNGTAPRERRIYLNNLPNPSCQYGTEGRAVLERFLEKNPKVAEAWRVCLESAEWFVPGAYARRWHSTPRGGAPEPVIRIPAGQKELVARAYAQCPDDEEIKAWHDFVTSGDPVPPGKARQFRERRRSRPSDR